MAETVPHIGIGRARRVGRTTTLAVPSTQETAYDDDEKDEKE
ncbi:MAG TPA: hypothetical protein VFT65_05090 [Candidatus Angelobacter sp.]|nr:hypothetical protein [Candidatus Angelobacter sp.]